MEDTEGGKALQSKFLDNQRYRIDARVVKNLKKQKRMKVKDLIEVVIADLNLQMALDENQEQLEALRKQILKQIGDLAVKEMLKLVEGAEKVAEYLMN